MGDFLFKPGDGIAMVADFNSGVFPTPRWTVLERITQECCGGIQRIYVIRTFHVVPGGGVQQQRDQVHDFEVRAYPTDEEMLENHRRMVKLRAAARKIENETHR